MKSSFLVGGCPKDLTEIEMKKAKFTSQEMNTKRDKSLKMDPFVMTYHPNLKQTSQAFRILKTNVVSPLHAKFF